MGLLPCFHRFNFPLMSLPMTWQAYARAEDLPVDWTPALEARHAALALRYDLKYFSVQLGTESVSFCAVADIDRLFDELIAKGDDHADVKDERIPYWADVWPSSVGLARYLLAELRPAASQRVIELGAGLGLVGMMTARLGLPSLITDYLPEAVEMMQFISDLNGLSQAQCQVVDWRTPDPALAADLVLAADVAYEARAFEPLIACFRQLLRPGGQVLVSEPGRSVAKGWLRHLIDQGLATQVARYEISIPDITQPVGIYRIQASDLARG
jgi:predicted nicotinamide N-methyase